MLKPMLARGTHSRHTTTQYATTASYSWFREVVPALGLPNLGGSMPLDRQCLSATASVRHCQPLLLIPVLHHLPNDVSIEIDALCDVIHQCVFVPEPQDLVASFIAAFRLAGPGRFAEATIHWCDPAFRCSRFHDGGHALDRHVQPLGDLLTLKTLLNQWPCNITLLLGFLRLTDVECNGLRPHRFFVRVSRGD